MDFSGTREVVNLSKDGWDEADGDHKGMDVGFDKLT